MTDQKNLTIKMKMGNVTSPISIFGTGYIEFWQWLGREKQGTNPVGWEAPFRPGSQHAHFQEFTLTWESGTRWKFKVAQLKVSMHGTRRSKGNLAGDKK